MNTSEFLSQFPGNTCYCTIDDKRKIPGLKHYHEGFDLTREQILTRLQDHNSNGLGIFFCVNEIDRNLDPQRTRTSKMLKNIRAVWADMDTYVDEPKMDWPIKPSIIVNTSPGKYHYYWLTNTTEVEEWKQVMNGIANTYGSDANARDLVRVLRLPGFNHLKSEPFMSTVVHCDGYVYEWTDIKESFPPDLSTRITTNATHGEHRTFSNYNEAAQSILEGENFHGAIMWLLNHYANKGITDLNELKDIVKSQLARSKVQDDRWESRNEDHYLESNIRDAVRFVSENPINEIVSVDVVDIQETQAEIGWPPGLMGELCKEIYEMAPHPNEEMAIMAAFTLVAGVAGRTFNVSGTGLNLYTACLARSGLGKSIIKDSINIALRSVGVLNGGPLFMGPSRITGPKALLRVLNDHPAQILVLEESGLLSASQAGDNPGVTRMLLELYTSSGKDQWYGAESYSKKEDSTTAVRAPAVTLAHVSTPESYIKAMKSKDSINSGDLARIWTLRSLRDKSYLNLNRRKTFSPPIANRINELLGLCKINQKTESHHVIDIDMSDIDVEGENRRWVDLENACFERDPIKATIASRAPMKTLKIASIASVFNDHGNKIGLDEFYWSKSAVMKEFASINIAISLGDASDMGTVIDNIVIPTITKIVNSAYTDPKSNPSKTLKGRGMFTKSNLMYVFKFNETIKSMGSDVKRTNTSVTGVDKVISYLIKNGMVEKVSRDALIAIGVKRTDAEVYRITNNLKDAIQI